MELFELWKTEVKTKQDYGVNSVVVPVDKIQDVWDDFRILNKTRKEPSLISVSIFTENDKSSALVVYDVMDREGD